MKELYDFLSEIDSLDEQGENELRTLIGKTTDLKQIPLVARKIMQIIEDPKSTAGDLERVIQMDQALTVKILKIANSSFYGLLRKVNTLQRAILVVGFKSIKDIAVSTAILSMYRSSDPASVKLWEHAIGAGIASRLLSLEFESTETEESFVGGLLHDLGKVLMLKAKPKIAKPILAAYQNDHGFDELEAERKEFHFCHTHAGGQLVRSWNLAPTLEAVMRYHHHLREVLWTDIDMAVKTNIAIVSYSNRICRRLGIGYEKPQPDYDVTECPEVEFLNLPQERIDQLIEEINLANYEESQLFA